MCSTEYDRLIWWNIRSLIQNFVVNCRKWKAEKEVLEVESWERRPTDRAVNNKAETAERGAAEELRHN